MNEERRGDCLCREHLGGQAGATWGVGILYSVGFLYTRRKVLAGKRLDENSVGFLYSGRNGRVDLQGLTTGRAIAYNGA